MTCLSTIKLHLAACKSTPAPIQISAFLNPRSGELTASEMRTIKDLQTKYVAGGLHSFLSIEEKGLIDLVQFGISIGSKYQNLDARSFWCGRKTVRTNLEAFTNQKIADMKAIIQKNQTSISFVSDIWSDSVNRDSFLDVTLFFVDDHFKLKHQCIAFK